jgi:hypothetical protein
LKKYNTYTKFSFFLLRVLVVVGEDDLLMQLFVLRGSLFLSSNERQWPQGLDYVFQVVHNALEDPKRTKQNKTKQSENNEVTGYLIKF